MIAEQHPLFPLGPTVATPGALAALTSAGQSPVEFLNKHVRGDWGDVCEDDMRANDDAVRHGERILSVYKTNLGVKIWCLTEADRSATTLLLPTDY